MATAVTSKQVEAQIQAQLQSRRAEYALNIARYMAWAAGLITLALFVAWLALRQYTQLLLLAGYALLVTIPSALYPRLHRRGREILGAFLFSAALIIAAGSIPLALPSTIVTAAIGLGIVAVLANQILGGRSRGLVLFAVLSMVADFLMVYVWPVSWPTSLNETVSGIIAAALSLVAFIVFVAIVRTVTTGQEDNFAQAQRANYEVETRAAAEQAQREHLQTTVQTYVEFMAEVAQGDLAVRLPPQESATPDDPLVILGRSLNETVASLQDMGLQIRESAGNLASAAAEILAAATQQASGASEQSAAIAQASTTIDEVRTIAEQTAQRARGVADLAQRVAQVAQGGQQAITSTVTGMDVVKGKVDSIAHDVLALSEQAQAIGSIISTVNQIASQSNMLALNASVEAARAGEAGKGFAVVASEVRSLAQQSKVATEQVREILTEIQRGVNTAVMATEEGIKGADSGVSLTSEAGESIRLLSESVEQSTQAAQQIAAASGQQQAGMEQIAAAMENIHQVTAQSVTSTKQVERAAGELSTLASQLRQLVEQYRL